MKFNKFAFPGLLVLLSTLVPALQAHADAVLIYMTPQGQSEGKAQTIDQVYYVGSTLIVIPKDRQPFRIPFLTENAAEEAFRRITEDEASISIESCALWGKLVSSSRWSSDPKCRSTTHQLRFKCGVFDPTPLIDLSDEEIRNNYREVSDIEARPLETTVDSCDDTGFRPR